MRIELPPLTELHLAVQPAAVQPLIVGADRKRPPVARNRLLKALELLQCFSAVGVCVGIIRPDLDRPLVARNRLLKVPELLEYITAIVVDIGMIRADRE